VIAQAGARGRPANALGQAGMALVARGVLSLIGLREFGYGWRTVVPVR
jgi:hypothetical protein